VSTVTGCLIWFMAFSLLILLPSAWLMSNRYGVKAPVILTGSVRPATIGLWLFAGCGTVFWLCLLPTGQRKQKLATRFCQLLKFKLYDDAAKLLDERGRAKFPAQWLPPIQSVLRGSEPTEFYGLASAAFARGNDSSCRVTLTGTFEEYLSQPILYWFHDDRCEATLNLIRSVVVDSILAAATLEKLDHLKSLIDRTHRMFERLDDETDQEDKTSPVDDPNDIHAWPEMTTHRRQLHALLLATAGDAYQQSDQEDADGSD